MNLDLHKVQSAKAFAPATSKGGRNVQSITLTFTELNGKRLTLSNCLIASLNLKDKVYIGIIADDMKIIIANHPLDGMDEYKLGKGGNVYNAGLVSGVIEAFGLESMYQNRTSHSFSNVEVDIANGIAVVTVQKVENN